METALVPARGIYTLLCIINIFHGNWLILRFLVVVNNCDHKDSVAQLVEQLTLNQRVQGSSPCGVTATAEALAKAVRKDQIPCVQREIFFAPAKKGQKFFPIWDQIKPG